MDDTVKQSKFGKALGVIGTSAASRSAIIYNAGNVVDSLRKPINKDESRLGNTLESIKSFLMNRSRLLQKTAGFSSVLKDVFGDDSKTKFKEGENQPKGTADTKILDFLQSKDNQYITTLAEGNSHLKEIVTILTDQSNTIKKILGVSTEASEASKERAAFDTVSRGNGASGNLGSAALGGGAALGVAASAESPAESNDSFGLGDLAVLGVETTGLAAIAGTLWGKTKALGTGIKNIISSTASRATAGIASLRPKIPANTPKIVPKIVPKSTGNWIRKLKVFGRVAGKLLGPVGIADTVVSIGTAITEEKKRTEESERLTREGDFAGAAKLWEGVPQNPYLKGEYSPVNPEYWEKNAAKIQKEWDDGAASREKKLNDEILEKQFNDRSLEQGGIPVDPMGNSGGSSSVTPIEPLVIPPKESIIDSMPTDPMGNPLPMIYDNPRPSPTNIIPNLKSRESALSFLSDSFQASIRPSSSQNSSPVIVKQGDKTSINNGGNVTNNIITGGSSLSLPQLQYNLPSNAN
jgi:hypothetical protein